MNKILTGPALTTIALPFVSTSALADAGSSYGDYHMEFGGWFLGPLMMIGVIALTVMAVVLVLRWMGAGGNFNRPSDRAITTLNERFARGEIDKEEFEERRRSLTS